MNRAPDAIVIGTGIVGASCAWTLARAGLSVLALDSRGPIAGGATRAGMGHIVMMDSPPAEFALVKRSMQLWDELFPQLPDESQWNRLGTLWIAGDAAEMEEALRKQERLRAAGISAELLDSVQVAKEEPQLRSGLAGGLLVPGDSALFPRAVAMWMLKAHGVEVRLWNPVRSIRSGKIELASGERLSARVIVNAAGMWGRGLTPGLPLVAKKGHLLAFGEAAGMCKHQIVELGYIKRAHGDEAESVSFNVQPRPKAVGGELVVGSSRQIGVDTEGVEPHIRDRMIHHAAAFMPALAGLKPVLQWTGVRAGSIDGLPIIGEHPSMSGIYLAGGHEGLGLTTALATAELITSAVLGQKQLIDPLPYSPSRFADVLKS